MHKLINRELTIKKNKKANADSFFFTYVTWRNKIYFYLFKRNGYVIHNNQELKLLDGQIWTKSKDTEG
jgi:hypothetical protein